MPSTSKRQARMMAAAAHDPKFAKKVGVRNPSPASSTKYARLLEYELMLASSDRSHGDASSWRHRCWRVHWRACRYNDDRCPMNPHEISSFNMCFATISFPLGNR